MRLFCDAYFHRKLQRNPAYPSIISSDLSILVMSRPAIPSYVVRDPGVRALVIMPLFQPALSEIELCMIGLEPLFFPPASARRLRLKAETR